MEQAPLSEKEIKIRQAEMKKFYEDRLPFLRIQHEYEVKNAEILEAHVRVINAQNRLAQYQMEKADFEKEQNSKNGSAKGNKAS